MRNRTFQLTRKRLALLVGIAAAVLAAVVLLCSRQGVLSLNYRVQTTEGRQAYLHALGSSRFEVCRSRS